MSQERKDKADTAEARTQQTRSFMQRVRVASRRKHTPEEKVRIVLNQYPKNYFAEVEQSAFSPANFVPGIAASPDKLPTGAALILP